ncbi:hypothetical protein MC7420_4542 [Coleofasciculus chthonoplastes PCC 7420]|uniref:Uncharacterized protein n=1 Tax=Coleofasciculus chthonoplastes PCC 7420 TaxID=118168 RepID=B4VNT1_9CYAN|nr:hypothetical protein MC7420_4542 [Coleofasciculus chthonoplastes PCC 7420]
MHSLDELAIQSMPCFCAYVKYYQIFSLGQKVEPTPNVVIFVMDMF